MWAFSGEGLAQPLQQRGRGLAETRWGSEEKATCPDIGELLAWMGTWGTDIFHTPLQCLLRARHRMLRVWTVSLAGTLVCWSLRVRKGGGAQPR